MSKHTPGPWEVSHDKFTGNVTIFPGVGSRSIASIHVGYSFERPESKTEEMYLANARLIAAAPDLLEALRGACLLVGNQLSPEGRQSVMKKMDAAIAKAEGRDE